MEHLIRIAAIRKLHIPRWMKKLRSTVAIPAVGIFILLTPLTAGLGVTSANNQLTMASTEQSATAEATATLAPEQVEAMRLASVADAELESNNSNAQTAALLSIRSLRTAYTAQADVALAHALTRMDVLRTFSGHTQIIESVAFSPDGKTVLTGSRDGTVRLWDVQTGQTIQSFSDPAHSMSCVAFSPDGKTILTCDGSEVRLW